MAVLKAAEMVFCAGVGEVMVVGEKAVIIFVRRQGGGERPERVGEMFGSVCEALRK